MRNKMRKLLALGLVFSMLLAVGCGSSTSSESTTGTDSTDQSAASEAESTASTESAEAEEKEPITVTIAVYKHTLSEMDDFNDMEGFRLAEEATGVHVEWIYVSSGTEDEKIATMLAGDLPDAFLKLLDETDISNNMDLFVDLTEDDMLQTYAPHVYADYQQLADGIELLTWPDGSIRSLATGPESSYQNDADGIMVINKA